MKKIAVNTISLLAIATTVAMPAVAVAQNPYGLSPSSHDHNTVHFAAANNSSDSDSPGGGARPAPSGGGVDQQLIAKLNELIKKTASVGQAVQNGNKLQVNTWNQTQQDLHAAKAQLLPTNLDFIWQLSGYQDATQIIAAQSKGTEPVPGNCPDGSSTCQANNNTLFSVLVPQKAESAGGKGQSSSAQDVLTNWQQSLVPGYDEDASSGVQQQLLAYAIAQVAHGNQSSSSDTNSPDYDLLQAITKPLSQDKDTDTSKTWFQQLSQASTPQLLRSIAVLAAVNNYIDYQRLRSDQIRQVVQVAAINQMNQLTQAINDLRQDNNRKSDRNYAKINEVNNSIKELNTNIIRRR